MLLTNSSNSDFHLVDAYFFFNKVELKSYSWTWILLCVGFFSLVFCFILTLSIDMQLQAVHMLV